MSSPDRWRLARPGLAGSRMVAAGLSTAVVVVLWMATIGLGLWEQTSWQWERARQLQTQYQSWRSVLGQVPQWLERYRQLMRCDPDCPQRWPVMTQGAQVVEQVHQLARQHGLQGMQLTVAAPAPQGDGWQRWPLKMRATGGFRELSAFVVAMTQHPGIGPLESLSLAPVDNVPGIEPPPPASPGLVLQAQWPLVLQPRLAPWVLAYRDVDPDPLQALRPQWQWRAQEPLFLSAQNATAAQVSVQRAPSPAPSPHLRGRVQQGPQQWALLEWGGHTHAVLPGQDVATSGWRFESWLVNGGVQVSRTAPTPQQIQLQALGPDLPRN